MGAKQFLMSAVDEISKSSPSLTSVLLLLIILFLSLRILGMLWRAFVFWITLVVKAALGVAVAFMAVWIITRGPEGFVDDVQDMGAYWMHEYKRYSRQSGIVQQWGSDLSNLYQSRTQKPQKKRW
jgi:hypothetical protein